MARRARLFDDVLKSDMAPNASTLGPTEAYGTKRARELAAAEETALAQASAEKRIISLVDPTAIIVDHNLRDRDIEAARLDPDYAEFLEDVRANGIKDPLGVRITPGTGIELVKGLRRLAAALDAGFAKVPVIENAYESDDAFVEDMLRENLLRQNPPAMEVARLFARLRDERGWSEERIGSLLRAKGGAISRFRTIARVFMPWLPDAYPNFRALPIVEMVRIAGIVEQNGDRRPLIVAALQTLAAKGEMDAKAVVEAIRSIAATGTWADATAEPVMQATADQAQRPQSRTAFDRQGTRAALLTSHEGQPVIRFIKRVPDYVIEKVWAEAERILNELDLRE